MYKKKEKKKEKGRKRNKKYHPIYKLSAFISSALHVFYY